MEHTTAAADEFARLVDLVRALRSPDGCPWDRAQTLQTLRPFVLEETYEVLEALDRDDHAALREELGDFLFEGVLLAQVCAEAGSFTVADSLRSISGEAGAAPPARLRTAGRQRRPRRQAEARHRRRGRSDAGRP